MPMTNADDNDNNTNNHNNNNSSTIEFLEEFVRYLSKVSAFRLFTRPKADCIRKLNVSTGAFTLDWLSVTPVDVDQLKNSLSYDLGLYFFIQDNYAKSLEYFELVKEYRTKVELAELFIIKNLKSIKS